MIVHERGILFSAPMVRAILAGKKTQARRAIEPQPPEDWSPIVGMYAPTRIDRHGQEYPGAEVFGASDEEFCARCPCGAPGDRLWVRETFMVVEARDDLKPTYSGSKVHEDAKPLEVLYRADCPSRVRFIVEVGSELPWKPSIHMPRWASRITLEITDVRVEQLQKISEEDATSEGVLRASDSRWVPYEGFQGGFSSARGAYAALWNSINGAGSWNSNPWAWVIIFKVLEARQ